MIVCCVCNICVPSSPSFSPLSHASAKLPQLPSPKIHTPSPTRTHEHALELIEPKKRRLFHCASESQTSMAPIITSASFAFFFLFFPPLFAAMPFGTNMVETRCAERSTLRTRSEKGFNSP